MHPNLARKPLKIGPFPVVAAHLPKEQARALRLRAVATGTPLSAILREAIGQWCAVNLPLNPGPVRDAPTVTAIAPIPQRKETRENTGRNETFRTLSKIDRTRKTAPKGSGFRD
jgi:hypothetical protein